MSEFDCGTSRKSPRHVRAVGPLKKKYQDLIRTVFVENMSLSERL